MPLRGHIPNEFEQLFELAAAAGVIFQTEPRIAAELAQARQPRKSRMRPCGSANSLSASRISFSAYA